jgi:hypothetical protein
MSVHLREEAQQARTSKWQTILYALDSTARTVRLCVIVLVASTPADLAVFVLHR